jgi:starch phosphorylase
MKPLSTLHIIPALPKKLSPLWELAYNLWWTWDQGTIRVLQQIAPETWIACGRNPLRFLSSLDPEQLDRLTQDEEISGEIEQIIQQFESYQSRPAWFTQTYPGSNLKIAYFSAEFGFAESLPIYSGGLGVLAGDLLKSASDLDLPFVGVGLLYRQGYFHQSLNPDGWQVELYPEHNFDQMPVRPVLSNSGHPLTVEVPYPEGLVYAQVWSVQVGRLLLYLLDASLEENRPEDREITARLYGGDKEMRLRQEILLGIGGLRALHSLGIEPTICHMNEGHSAFQALERIRLLMQQQDLSFAAAREASSAGNVFTTHTPVAAGNDWFPAKLVEDYLAPYGEELGLSSEELLGLGRLDPEDHTSDFGMTVLALRLSAHANGVSRLHGEVSRRMWASLWPQVDSSEVPITSITNGIHTPSWISLGMADLYDRYLGLDWRHCPEDPQVWKAIEQIPDGELWQVHQYRRQRLLEYARFHLENQFTRQGFPNAKIERSLQGLNPQALTIGFARRFATYKRGTLLMHDIERLAALFDNPTQPLQVLFAGKAHPHDHLGKELIREIVHLARQEPFAGKIFFLQDYDMNVARYLVQGCDVWLNNPRRPQEASGTSGMKAALNGALNVSVLDGWWAEACEFHSGWTIGLGEEYEETEYQDKVESNALYDLLETEVIPLFYDRNAAGLPEGWIARMKDGITTLAPTFSANRMVREYAEVLYLPNQERWEQLNSDRARIEELTRWKAHVRANWDQVHIEHVEATPAAQLKVGMQVPLQASILLGALAPEDVRVELYMGKLNAQREIQHAETLPLRHLEQNSAGNHLFAGEFPCTASGSHGYTLRVLPHHPDLKNPLELGLVCWAQEH